MAIFAIMKDGIVENTIVADQLEVVQLFFPENEVIEQTDSTGPAGVGSDFVGGQFRHVAPFNSWKWDIAKADWVAPKLYPIDGNRYVWDESALEWVSPETSAP